MELKRNTAATVLVGAFVDPADGVTPKTALTLTARLSKNGGAWGNRSSASAITHTEDGFYAVPLDATDTNTLGNLQIKFVDAANHLPVWQTYDVKTETDQDVLTSTRLAAADYTAPPSAGTIAAAVWAAGTRTLTGFGTLVADIWANVTRTLTSAGAGGATAQEVWEYATRALTAGIVPAASPVNPSTLTVSVVRGDDYVTTPLQFTGMPNLTGWTITFKIGDLDTAALGVETTCSYAAGVVSVQLDGALTTALTRSSYHYTLEAVNGGEVRSLAVGKLNVSGKVLDAP